MEGGCRWRLVTAAACTGTSRSAGRSIAQQGGGGGGIRCSQDKRWGGGGEGDGGGGGVGQRDI